MKKKNTKDNLRKEQIYAKNSEVDRLYSLSLSISIVFLPKLLFCDQISPFTLTHEDLGDNIYRWIFKDPYIAQGANDRFYLTGVMSLNWQLYTQANNGNGEYDDRIDWLQDQVAHLFQWNINALGWCCGYGFYSDKRYYDPQLHTYTKNHFWETTQMFIHLNNPGTGLPYRNQVEPGVFNRPYCPFTVNVNIIPHFQAYCAREELPGATIFEYLPDVWSTEFWQKAILRAFLMCSDGQGENYQPINEPRLNNGVLEIPDSWHQHDPAGMRNQKALVFYSLGNDLYWHIRTEWNLPDRFGRRKWLTRIIWMDGTQPGKEKFARAMKKKYEDQFGTEAVAQWNSIYGTNGKGFHDITCFLDADGVGDYYSLQSHFHFVEQFQSLGLQYTEDNFETAMRQEEPPPMTLGWMLETSDARYFMTWMATKFYFVATEAIRYFDSIHLIFSDRNNWAPGTFPAADDGTGKDMRYIIEKAAAKVPGISGFCWHRYSTIPENNIPVPGDSQATFYSFQRTYDEIVESYYKIMDDGIDSTMVKPSVIVEWTDHSDWQKRWDYNWFEDNKCGDPAYYQGQGLENLSNTPAPPPHGTLTGPGGAQNGCNHPDNYLWTETGILYDDITLNGTERGKHHDYEDYLNKAVNTFTYENGPSSYHDYMIVGEIYAGYYDLSFGIRGEPVPPGGVSDPTQNWGLVNPKVSPDALWELGQYQHLLESLEWNNGCAQLQAGATVWNNENHASNYCDEWGKLNQ